MTLQRVLVFALLLVTTLVSAQDLTHPTQMGLPESRFKRPDPSDYLLSLENGLTAYVAAADQVPLVTLSAFIRVGLIDDDNEGAAEALLQALRHAGPQGLDPEEFKRALRVMTAEYIVDMHDEWTEISINVPVEDLEQALDMFSGLIKTPEISAASLVNAAKGAAPESSDPGAESGTALYEGSLAIAVDRFRDVLYAGHPYGYRPTEENYEKLTVGNVRAFHARYFVPSNITLAIAGDIDPEDIQTRIAGMFGDMKFSKAPAPKEVPPVESSPTKQHTFPVEKLQSWLVFGHALPEVPLADQAALEVMNYILAGGHLYTRMTVETRYRYGYTNDASGFLEPHWFGPGSYDFRSYSRHEVIKPIFENMMAEIERIREEEVSDEELFIAKGALTDGTHQVRYLDGYAIARSFALERLRYGNHNWSARYVRRIRAVKARDVLNAARKYLHPDRMQVVLVGESVDLID